jgi:hypothetical protein
LILSRTARNLASPVTTGPIIEQARSLNTKAGMTMKSVIAAVIVIAGATSVTDAADAQGATETLRPCTARVVYSEELPFAPIDSWLVKVTLQITPQNGAPYITTLHDRMPWQGPPPRRGQTFRLWCDPANPNHLRLASGAVVKSAF